MSVPVCPTTLLHRCICRWLCRIAIRILPHNTPKQQVIRLLLLLSTLSAACKLPLTSHLCAPPTDSFGGQCTAFVVTLLVAMDGSRARLGVLSRQLTAGGAAPAGGSSGLDQFCPKEAFKYLTHDNMELRLAILEFLKVRSGRCFGAAQSGKGVC